MPRRLRSDEYTIAWICALPIELAAALEMLDEEHEGLERTVRNHDENTYCLGSITGHNVVIVCLPAGCIGNNSAATVATDLRRTFGSIQIGLMVGIGGGVPSPEADIRLGDVVVSQPQQASGGIIQYDLGKSTPHGFVRTGLLNAPPRICLAALARIRADAVRGKSKMPAYLSSLERAEFHREMAGPDLLFQASYEHESEHFCESCQPDRLVTRPVRTRERPITHYGVIASGNQVIRDGAIRDKVSKELGGVLCFEMEAAGLMNTLPCLVIRGICDYSDSHKSKRFQPYAAATAAAYAKEVLSVIAPAEVAEIRAPQDIQSFHTTANRTLPQSTVPFRRDEDFIHHNSLDKIHQLCTKPAGRAALVGLGGVGKSQIAIEYAYQARVHSSENWIFWVHAGSRARFEDGYRRIAEVTKLDGWNDRTADVLRLVRNWLCNESNGSWTMIIDNADDTDILFPVNSPRRTEDGTSLDDHIILSDFLPQSSNGSILITSRNRDLAYRLTGNYASIIDISPMNKDDAMALFKKKLVCTPDEHDDAVGLLEALDFMPLAISQAAAFIQQRKPRMTTKRYLEDMRKDDDDRAKLLQKDIGDDRRDGRASNAIITTWQISFKYIQQNWPTAADLLSLMCFLDRQGIPESLLQSGYATKDHTADFEDDIHLLISYSLVEMSSDSTEFKMHRLVQLSIRKWLEINHILQDRFDAYVNVISDHYPHGHYDQWIMYHQLYPHVQAALQLLPTDERLVPTWASLLDRVRWYLLTLKKYDQAYQVVSTTATVCERLLGENHEITLGYQSKMGSALNRKRRFDEAEALLQRVLATQTKLLGQAHRHTIPSMSTLAGLYFDTNRFKDAAELYQQAYHVARKSLGVSHEMTTSCMGNIAKAYGALNRLQDARKMYEALLDIYRIARGVKHPDTLWAMIELAYIYKKEGQLETAAEILVSVLDPLKAALGAEHPYTLSAMSNLSRTWQRQGRYKEASELWREYLPKAKHVWGESHHQYRHASTNIADCERKLAERESRPQERR